MLPSQCGDYIINHDMRIPIKQPVFDGKYPSLCFPSRILVLVENRQETEQDTRKVIDDRPGDQGSRIRPVQRSHCDFHEFPWFWSTRILDITGFFHHFLVRFY